MFIKTPFEEKTHAHFIKVEASCGQDGRGYWWCLRCAHGFENNFGAMQHCEEKPKHRIVWFCHDHGFETA